jgi:WD40 repeat protein
MMNIYHADHAIGIMINRNVYVWNASTGILCHKLAGHSSTVNETAISSKSVIASGSSDKTIYVGELKH